MQDTAPSDQPETLTVPTQSVWDAMTGAEQAHIEMRIINALENEHSLMGETTVHFQARSLAADVLRRYFDGQGKKVFIASDLHTLYPSEQAFYPDLLMVFEAEDHHRRSWNVLREKKGLDFVLEILSKSTRRKDQVEKLNLYARLSIPEYFMFDPDRCTLRGFQLNANAIYEEIPPSAPQRVFSKLLGLYLTIDAPKLRFILPQGNEVLFADELIHRLNDKLSDKDATIADSLRQVEEEIEQKEEERRQKEEAIRLKEEERQQKEEEKARADKLEEELVRLRQLLNKQER